MSPNIATFIFAIGILGLFYLDYDRRAGTSKALWLPVLWIWIAGSRSITAWMGMDQTVVSSSQLAEGSPFDRLFFQLLLGAGILVIICRGKRTIVALRENWAILLYFSYCLLSIAWSDYPDVALKRWTKGLGDLVMILIVVTDSKPAAALRRVFSRVGFILLPVSILLIKYYGSLGRAFDPYGWMEMTGVTTDKNLLGVITFILSLGAVWSMLASLRSRSQPHRSRHLLAQASLLAFGLLLLAMAGSATSAACFGLGAGLMVATSLPWIGRRPAAVHALVVTIVAAAGIAMLSGADADVIHAMGRKTDFTGRTDIWKAVIRLAPNPVVGAGFESFWLGQRLEKMWRAFPVFQPNEAHNGYIEVYINLGWLGVGLIVLLLINGYFRAVAAFRRDPEIGGLMLAFVGSAAVYSVTEAGFRMLNPIWIFLLLAIAGGSRIAARVGGKAQRSLVRDSKPPSMPAAPDVLPLSPTDGRVEAV